MPLTLCYMVIHIGKKIKEELYNQKIPVSAFAKKINRSRNVVYDIFERESIDTDLLNKISKILNCDFFSVYSSQKEYSIDKVKNFNVNDPAILYGKHAEELEAMKQQNEILLNEISYLKKIISLMETKNIPGSKTRKK